MARNPGINLEQWVVDNLSDLFPEAKRMKASGSVWQSGDVQAGPFEIETKDNPSRESVSIHSDVLKRTEAAAKRSAKIPVVVNRVEKGTYVTLRWNDFKSLLLQLTESPNK